MSKDTGEIWRLAWPIMVGITTHMLFHLVDLYWIGFLGKAALAGVAAAGALVMFLWTGTRIASAGGVAVISQALGRDDKVELRKGAADTIFTGAFLGVIVFFLTYSSLEQIVAFFKLEDAASLAAISYLRVSLLGVPLLYLLEGSVAYVIGVGETRVLMYVGLVCNVINMFVDPLLMFGYGPIPKLGLQGAAWASLLSSVILFALVVGWQAKNAGLKLGDFRIRLKGISTILRIGLPAASRDLSRPLVAIVIMRLVAQFGSATVAAYGISSRIMGIVIIYIIGLSVALNQMTGKRIGEGKVHTVEAILKTGGRIGFAVHTVVATFLICLAGPLLSLFDRTGAVVEAGVPIVRIFAVMMVFPLIVRVMGAAFSGSGNTKPLMFSSISAHWLVQFPLALAAVTYWGNPLGVWLAILVARAMETAFLWTFYRTYEWQKSALVATEAAAN